MYQRLERWVAREARRLQRRAVQEAKVKPILRVECKDFNIDGYHLLCQSAIKEYVIKTQISLLYLNKVQALDFSPKKTIEMTWYWHVGGGQGLRRL